MTLVHNSEVVNEHSTLPPADYLAETRSLYDSLGYPAYQWAQAEPPKQLEPLPDLADAEVLLIGSGGIYARGQVAFTTKDDTSIRKIAIDTPTSELRTAHFAYDQADARADPNCIFPIDRLRDLAADGLIGGVSDAAYGFMGGIYSVRRMREETIPRLIEACANHEPDIVLLVPV